MKETNLKLYKAMAVAVFLHSSEAWMSKKGNWCKFQAVEMKCLTSVQFTSWQINYKCVDIRNELLISLYMKKVTEYRDK